MATMREIKGRIRSVTTTKKTTKAMNLVSSSKMARAKVKFTKGAPFFNEMRRAIGNIVVGAGEVKHRYFEPREIKTTMVIVIANDRGLCGGYNTNILKHSIELRKKLLAEDPNRKIKFFTIGNKARDFTSSYNRSQRERDHKHVQIILKDGDHMSGISENPFYDDAVDLANKLLPRYEAGEFDQLYICYTEFVSAITYVPTSLMVLPLDPEEFKKSADSNASFIKFEPSPSEVIDYIVPKYFSTVIFGALTSAATSGQAATMTAMDSATENAENIIGNLTLQYNRARQAAITQEISEIVGGANALE